MFDEIDYILEARNAERFATLYSNSASKFSLLLLCLNFFYGLCYVLVYL